MLIPRGHAGCPWRPVDLVVVVVQDNVVCIKSWKKCIDVGDELITPPTVHETLCTTHYTLQNDAPHIRLHARLYTTIHMLYYTTHSTHYKLQTVGLTCYTVYMNILYVYCDIYSMLNHDGYILRYILCYNTLSCDLCGLHLLFLSTLCTYRS